MSNSLGSSMASFRYLLNAEFSDLKPVPEPDEDPDPDPDPWKQDLEESDGGYLLILCGVLTGVNRDKCMVWLQERGCLPALYIRLGHLNGISMSMGPHLS